MPIYWVNIDVKFKEPMKLEDEEENSNEKIYGYLQNIGATFPNEQLLKANIFSLVCEDFDADNVEIIYESVGVIPLHKVKKEIYGDKDIGRLLRSEPKNDGVWYKTGRGFYTDED